MVGSWWAHWGSWRIPWGWRRPFISYMVTLYENQTNNGNFFRNQEFIPSKSIMVSVCTTIITMDAVQSAHMTDADTINQAKIAVSHLNRVMTDGTFIAWMKETQQYTTERERLYLQWQKRCHEYREAEFATLLSRTTTQASKAIE